MARIGTRSRRPTRMVGISPECAAWYAAAFDLMPKYLSAASGTLSVNGSVLGAFFIGYLVPESPHIVPFLACKRYLDRYRMYIHFCHTTPWHGMARKPA